MGDDVDAPHSAEFNLDPTLPLKELIIIILNKYQLASVATPMVYWICRINRIHVATIMVTEELVRKINFVEDSVVEFSPTNQVHFKYTY